MQPAGTDRADYADRTRWCTNIITDMLQCLAQPCLNPSMLFSAAAASTQTVFSQPTQPIAGTMCDRGHSWSSLTFQDGAAEGNAPPNATHQECCQGTRRELHQPAEEVVPVHRPRQRAHAEHKPIATLHTWLALMHRQLDSNVHMHPTPGYRPVMQAAGGRPAEPTREMTAQM